MELYTAFLLGLVGSLHCAGMCGPLALALPTSGSGRLAFAAGRAGYNLGRITAYCLLGLVFGLAGRSAALAGFQRWASLIAGAAVLIALIPATRRNLALPATKSVAGLKRAFGALLRRRGLGALYLLGVLNGFLPCGLVYVACAGAVTLGSASRGVAYLLAFGIGTVPMMFGIGFVGKNFQMALRFRWQRLIPACVALVGVLLLLRGLALGIPYLSPDLASVGGAAYCH
jgi:uncharacterized protein